MSDVDVRSSHISRKLRDTINDLLDKRSTILAAGVITGSSLVTLVSVVDMHISPETQQLLTRVTDIFLFFDRIL